MNTENIQNAKEERTTLWVSRLTHSRVEQIKAMHNSPVKTDEVVADALQHYMDEQTAS